jgi:uncharacterized protein
MKLSAESGSGNVIRSFKPGELRLSEHTFENHIILSASKIIRDWKPAPFSELSIADFEPAIALDPEIILFGTGERQRFPDHALMIEIMRQGIAFEVMDTAAACRTFNVLVSEFREVVAALLVQNLP